MVPDHQVRRKWSGDASKKVQLFKVGGSRFIGTAVRRKKDVASRIEPSQALPINLHSHRLRDERACEAQPSDIYKY